MGDDGIPSVEALEGAHSFPERFTIKAIGFNDAAFGSAVREAAVAAVVDAGRVDFVERASANGTYVSISVVFLAERAETVQALYRRLQGLPGLKQLL